jgi:hypothetical protein
MSDQEQEQSQVPRQWPPKTRRNINQDSSSDSEADIDLTGAKDSDQEESHGNDSDVEIVPVDQTNQDQETLEFPVGPLCPQLRND